MQANMREQQEQQPQDSAAPAAMPAKMEVEADEKGKAPSRRSSVSSTSSERPSLRTIHKAVRCLREDVDDALDAQEIITQAAHLADAFPSAQR